MPRKSDRHAKFQDPRPLTERPLARSAGPGKRNARKVTINLAESPLSWLHARGHLDDRQLLAGETLRGDYESASLAPRVTMRWDAAPVERRRTRAPASPTDQMIVAKRRFDAALASVGPDLADIVWRVICAGEGLPVAERALGWPSRSGKIVLRIALDRLAAFYRLPGG